MTALSLAPPASIRGRLEQIAHATLTGRVSGTEALEALAELSPLPDPDAAIWFADLCQGVADLSLPWQESIPDATGIERDEQATDAANTRINLALDALTGAAS